jgi:hypothetical protein
MYVQNMYVLQLMMDVKSNIYEHGWMLTNVNEMSTNEIHPQLLNTIHLFQYCIHLHLLFNPRYY